MFDSAKQSDRNIDHPEVDVLDGGNDR